MGPLAGITVVELAGLGPGPFAAMMLADMGADVVRVDRPGGAAGEVPPEQDLLTRSRRSLALDLKQAAGIDALLRLVDRADVLIDPFRPGVAERLGVGPEACEARNPRLVYGRMTGWGQTGPLAPVAAHDVNYLALAGPLAAMGRRDSPPPPPLNLIGDFGAGGMLLAFGIAAALIERERSGRGQTIDAAMLDGIALLSTAVLSTRNAGVWTAERESNSADGGAHYYDTYETKDGRHISIASMEPRFYADLLERLGLDPAEWPHDDREAWPALSAKLAEVFRTRTRDEWCAELEGTDVCFAPVLTYEEAAEHPHVRARGLYDEAFGLRQPAVAPRLQRTPGTISAPPCLPGEHSRAVLRDWGFSAAEVDALEAAGVTRTNPRDGS